MTLTLVPKNTRLSPACFEHHHHDCGGHAFDLEADAPCECACNCHVFTVYFSGRLSLDCMDGEHGDACPGCACTCHTDPEGFI